MNIKGLIQTVLGWGAPAPISKKEARRRNNVLPAYFDPSNQPGEYIRNSGNGPDFNSRAQEIGKRSAGIRRVRITH